MHTSQHEEISGVAVPKRVGLLVVGLPQEEVSRLQYLLLQVNRLQRSIEYEFTPEFEPEPNDNDDKVAEEFIALLSREETISRDSVRDQIPAFVERYRKCLLRICTKYKIQEVPPDYFVVVSMARFDTDYYTTREGPGAVIALGNWKEHMAPPTLIEFFLTLVVREGIAASAPGLRGSIHLGTKGCLCDFTYNISDARYKVLNAFVCSYCRKQLAADSLPLLADEVEQVLAKAWVGKAADAESPAAILAKLGLNLFTTKALKPGSWERFTTVLTEEGAKQAMRLISYVLVALFGALLVLLGVKAAGPAAEIHTKADSQLEHARRALPPNQTPPSC